MTSTCRHCGERIVLVNWAMGPGWTHQPEDAAFQDGMHVYCHVTRAAEPEPEPAACCPHCGCEHGHLAQPTLTGEPVYICASCKRVSLREEWSR